ncbi:hypothetical protein ES695_12360, partial [Candidatus Atribacteria bacterium 1244-E10-H5-B2]
MKKSQEVSIKKNDEIILSKIIKPELNLLELPFFALNRKNLSKKLKTEYRSIRKRGDHREEVSWSVLANSEYGYPGPFDREVHKAVEQIISEILKEEGEIKNPIPFSIYNLCNRMGITSAGGDNYQRIKKALERIQMTGIKSEGAFYHKGKKKWISSVFGLYDGVIFKGEQIEGDIIAETNLLYLGDIYLQSLNSHHIKSLDYTYWQSLKSKIASRLYEILGIKFYGARNKKEEFIRYKYSTLCQLLPVIPYRYIFSAKRQLNSGNDELKDSGFISKYAWSENGKGKNWIIYYWPGERAKEEIRKAKMRIVDFQTGEYLPGPKRELGNFSQEQNDLIDKLVESNVSRITAEGLIIKYDQQLIEKWVGAINYSNADDKAAYLVKAIRENWQVPEEYLKEEEDIRDREEQEKIRIAREKQKEEENKRRR